MEYEKIYIEKQTDKESYAGVCEDYKLGLPLIFYLQNISDYAKSQWFNYSNKHLSKVRFSALCTDGVILLGIKKSKFQRINDVLDRKFRNDLMSSYIKGDKDALDFLAQNEMVVYESVTSRVKNEDLLSIIETSIMPFGFESDHYLVVGNIINVQEEKNTITDETIYNLLIETYDILINVGINSMDLQGEPKEGRRFRGEIWLQGYVKI